MANSMTDSYLGNNKQYASGQTIHKPAYPGKQPINPAKHVAVVACMDARLDVEDLLGLQTGDAHIIRNAGGVVSDDAIRCLIISHHLLNTNEIILIHHTRCGMLAFTDDLLKAGLEGDPAAEKLLGQATSRPFMSCKKCASTPSQFHAFRGPLEPLDGPRNAKQTERLQWDVRRGMSSILNHPWIPTSGPDAVTVRGFIYDVDTGKLEEVSYPGPMGSIGWRAEPECGCRVACSVTRVLDFKVRVTADTSRVRSWPFAASPAALSALIGSMAQGQPRKRGLSLFLIL